MIRTSFLILLACAQVLHADIENYFKKAEGKTAGVQVRNIDFIYMINLDQRPEKYASCVKELSPYGIVPYRFSAVNGWELSLDAINDVGVLFGPWMTSGKMGTCYLPEDGGEPHHEFVQKVGRCYYGHCMSRGAIGIVLSHLSILQDAYDSGYETIWVMEDDIEVIRDPHLLAELIENLDALVGKEGWDILFTDRDTKGQQGNYVPCTSFAWRPNFSPQNPQKFIDRWDVSAEFRYIGARYGAYSMIVRRSGMEKLLNFFKQYDIFLPFDMDYTVVPGIRFFTVNEDVVSTQPKALSDNAAPNYQKP